MSNANLSLITTANVFNDWLILTNNEANSINELRNGNYYKDGGNFTVANGSVLLTKPTGTTLSVTANVSVSNLITTNSLAVTGVATLSGNLSITGGANVANINVSSTANVQNLVASNLTLLNVTTTNANVVTLNVSANIANAGNVLVTQNLYAGNVILSQNIAIGNISVTQNITSGNGAFANINITIANVSTLNISSSLVDMGSALFAGPLTSNRAAIPGVVMGLSANTLVVTTNTSNSGANNGLWEVTIANTAGSANTGQITYRTGTDDQSTAFNNYLQVNRANVNVTKIIIGNQADSPSINLVGSVNIAGTLAAGAVVTPNAAIYANGTVIVQTSNVNFNNTATVQVAASANGATQGNIAFNVNQSANYTWTGIQTFQGPYDYVAVLAGNGGRNFGYNGNDWYTLTVNQNSPVNNRAWFEHYSNTGLLEYSARPDNLTFGRNYYAVQLTGNAAISSITYGNATDQPEHLVYGYFLINTGIDQKISMQGSDSPYITFWNSNGTRTGVIQVVNASEFLISSADTNLPLVLDPGTEFVSIQTNWQDEHLRLVGSSNPYISFFNGNGTRQGYIQLTNSNQFRISAEDTNLPIYLASGSQPVVIYTGGDQMLRLAGSDNPYISFFNANGARQGYIQSVNNLHVVVTSDAGQNIAFNPTEGTVEVWGISTANVHRDAYANLGVITGNTNINCAAAVYQDLMLASNPTITFQNTGPTGQMTVITLTVRQSQNGSNTVAWSNTIRWSDNNVPVLSTTKNTSDEFTFTSYNGGTVWYGRQSMGNTPLANIW